MNTLPARMVLLGLIVLVGLIPATVIAFPDSPADGQRMPQSNNVQTPTPTPTPDLILTPTSEPTPTSTLTPTPTLTEAATPSPTPSASFPTPTQGFALSPESPTGANNASVTTSNQRTDNTGNDGTEINNGPTVNVRTTRGTGSGFTVFTSVAVLIVLWGRALFRC